MIMAKRVLLQATFLLLISVSALADGKVFARAVAVPVATPDQRAMLYFSNGVERLVIETSFIGVGTNFAWVVPFPSAPRIEAVSTNFFAYLNSTYQPKLIVKADPSWALFLITGYLAAVCVWTYRNPGTVRFIVWLGMVFLPLLLLVGMQLPNLVLARGMTSAYSQSSVAVLNQQMVGIYDTVTLASADGRELLDWLNTHGFHTPTAALPVISDYAKQGWVFVAATINRDAGVIGGSRPHPLAFTFSSDKPVYPLRLTGIENNQCSIELFVFGPEKAEAAGFRPEYCGNPTWIGTIPRGDLFTRQDLFLPPPAGKFLIGNPEVVRLTARAPVTTKLVAQLTAQDMQSDAVLRWTPYESIFPTLYSREAATGAAFNWLIGFVVPGLLLLYLLSPGLGRSALGWGCAIVIVVAVMGGLGRYYFAKTTEVIITHGRWFAVNNFRQLDACIDMYALERKKPGVLTADELLRVLREYSKGGLKNTFVDQPLRCEPTPGNITLRVSSNEVVVFWHDIHNAPRPLTTFPITSK